MGKVAIVNLVVGIKIPVPENASADDLAAFEEQPEDLRASVVMDNNLKLVTRIHEYEFIEFMDEPDEEKTPQQKFEEMLKQGAVTFTYEKVNGGLRLAVGTLNAEKLKQLLPDQDADKKPRVKQVDPDVVFYYDLEADGFRQCKFSKIDPTTIKLQGTY